jgi:hypothetical protein
MSGAEPAHLDRLETGRTHRLLQLLGSHELPPVVRVLGHELPEHLEDADVEEEGEPRAVDGIEEKDAARREDPRALAQDGGDMVDVLEEIGAHHRIE